MNLLQPSARPTECWQLEALPGDGLIVSASNHVLIVEVDDEISGSGVADEIVAASDAHSRLLGHGAARSLRVAISAILAAHGSTPCSVALVSVWDDKIAVFLHGEAAATLSGGGETITLCGRGSLVATDAILTNEFDQLELYVGEQPEDDRVPLDIGEVVPGRGVRMMLLQQRSSGAGPLNSWGAG